MGAYGAYKNVRSAAWQVLLACHITKIPVDVVKIASLSNISIVKNSEVEELKLNELGVSILDGEKWYIVYDDTLSREWICFTIAHELGHIFLGHPLKTGYNAMTINTGKPEIEKQADMFAMRVLVPSCVVWGLNLRTADEIQKEFQVTYAVAKLRSTRMKILYDRNEFLSNDLERKVYANFKDYIDFRKASKL